MTETLDFNTKCNSVYPLCHSPALRDKLCKFLLIIFCTH